MKATRDADDRRDWILVFALADEARPFLERWEQGVGQRVVRRDPRGLPKAMSRWECGDVEVWTCGMGPRNAARWTEWAFRDRLPRRVVTAGYAGALDPALAIGQVVASADPGYPPVDGARWARFHCSDHVATTAVEKAALRARMDADAVEMESGVIREACARRGIPSATIRVISDGASEDLPLDFGALLTRDDRLHFGKLAWRIVRSPKLIPGLIRLGKTTRIAAGNLAEVLVRHLGPA